MPAATEADSTADPRGVFPVLLGLREMVRLFDVAEFTVYRWNSSKGRPRQLPEPFLTVSGTSIFTEGQIREFAERKGLTLNAEVLDEIRASQGHQTST